MRNPRLKNITKIKQYYELQYQEAREDNLIIKRFTRKSELTKYIKKVVPKCLMQFQIIWYKRNFGYDLTLTKKYIKFEVPVRYILK